MSDFFYWHCCFAYVLITTIFTISMNSQRFLFISFLFQVSKIQHCIWYQFLVFVSLSLVHYFLCVILIPEFKTNTFQSLLFCQIASRFAVLSNVRIWTIQSWQMKKVILFTRPIFIKITFELKYFTDSAAEPSNWIWCNFFFEKFTLLCSSEKWNLWFSVIETKSTVYHVL